MFSSGFTYGNSSLIMNQVCLGYVLWGMLKIVKKLDFFQNGILSVEG